MPFVNRFSTTTCGAMTFTGNTLGLSQQLNSNNAGTLGSIGAFVTTDIGMQANATYPFGTTFDYLENSASAELVIPSGSTILYAELIWGGNYLTRDEDISGIIDDDITFTDSDSISHTISVDPATSNNETFTTGGITRGFYMRSADVTSIVQSAGAGTYTAGQIPGLIDPLLASTAATNHAGWTLAVIYENLSSPYRAMNLFVGSDGIVVNATGGSPTIDVPVTGFMTGAIGDVDARLLISAQEGDADIAGDQALFGPNAGTLTNLSGPNNPANNFFGSQINDDSGNLDTTGTFGTRNQDPFTQTNIVAGRQSWDITNVSGFNLLPNNQSSAVFRFTTVGDAYMPNALGAQIDVAESDIEVDKSVDIPFSTVGDVLTYTVTITNNGTGDEENGVFTDTIPMGTVFVEDSLYIDGVAFPGVNPQYGVALPTIGVGDTIEVTFQVIVKKKGCFISNQAEVEFSCGKIARSNLAISTVCKQCSPFRFTKKQNGFY